MELNKTLWFLLIWICSYMHYYAFQVFLYILSGWVRFTTYLLCNHLQSILHNPSNKGIKIKEAITNTTLISEECKLFVSWLLESDEDGYYINLYKLHTWISDIPSYLSMIKKDNNCIINIDRNKRIATYDNGTTQWEIDIMFNCLRLNNSQ